MKMKVGILALAVFTTLAGGLVVSHQASASGSCPKGACPRAAGESVQCSKCTRACKPPCPGTGSGCSLCAPGGGRAL